MFFRPEGRLCCSEILCTREIKDGRVRFSTIGGFLHRLLDLGKITHQARECSSPECKGALRRYLAKAPQRLASDLPGMRSLLQAKGLQTGEMKSNLRQRMYNATPAFQCAGSSTPSQAKDTPTARRVKKIVMFGLYPKK